MKALEEAENYVRQHYLDTRASLIAKGYPEDRAERMAGVRIFDEPPGIYNLNTARIAESSGTWDSDLGMANDYLKKMGQRMRLVGNPENGILSTEMENGNSEPVLPRIKSRVKRSRTIRLAIFASGVGSNAQKIIDHFRYSSVAKVVVIVCNKPGAGVLKIAEQEHIPVIQIEKEKFFRGNGYVDELKEYQADLIILCGFLWKIPVSLLKAWPGKIINIHPALLPKYGGKGMYGQFVHEAVLANKDKESGISIHYVDEIYDHGAIIFQVTCPVLESDTPQSLAQRIHKLEHTYYPETIEKVINTLAVND